MNEPFAFCSHPKSPAASIQNLKRMISRGYFPAKRGSFCTPKWKARFLRLRCAISYPADCRHHYDIPVRRPCLTNHCQQNDAWCGMIMLLSHFLATLKCRYVERVSLRTNREEICVCSLCCRQDAWREASQASHFTHRGHPLWSRMLESVFFKNPG